MKKYIVLVGLIYLIGVSAVGYAQEASEPVGALEQLVASSEPGMVLYLNGKDQGEKYPALRVPVLEIGEEFPVFLNLVIVDKSVEYDPAAALSMDIIDAVNLLAKAIDQKVKYQQSKRFQFGIGVDINKKLLEFKPDVFGYATYQLIKY